MDDSVSSIRDEKLFSPERLKMIRDAQRVEMEWMRQAHITDSEHKFTSTGSKLNHHQEVMKRFHETGYATPIVSHIMPTDSCNLACSFCSVGNRNDGKTGKIYGLELDKINTYLDTLVPLGLKAVILSGGGEPTIYQDAKGNRFRDLIANIKSKGLEIGLITNGTTLEPNRDLMDNCFKWVRVSLYPSEYGLDIIKLAGPLPESTTLGFSLVIAQGLKEGKKFRVSRDKNELVEYYSRHLEEIVPFIQEKQGSYLRLTPDCHVHGEDFVRLHHVAEELKNMFSTKLTSNGDPIVLHQNKMHGTPNNCYLGFFHPVLYADGLVYPCDSNILNDELDKRFKSEYSIASWDTVSKLYSLPVKSLVNTNSMCPRCVFRGNNTLLQEILENGPQKPSTNVQNHVNFI